MGAIQDLNCEPWIASGSAEPRLGRCVRKDKIQSMLSIKTHRTIKALSVITVGFVVFVGVGVLVTRLTVHDLVEVSEPLKNCVTIGLEIHYDNPLERIVIYFGRSRITSVRPASAETESFTIYHIPIGVLRGAPDLKTSINCSFPLGDWEASNNI